MKEPKRKEPARKRVPWPPADADRKREVNLNDNWWTLAKELGRDPWDLIVYNFDTRDPDEVNWYLYHWINCRAVTPDGKNYRFGPHDLRKPVPPGPAPKLHIYIPPAAWKPDDDASARQFVRQTLLSPAARSVQFTMPKATIWPGQIGNVGMLVSDNRITVRYAPHLATAGIGARYEQESNLMEIASLSASNATRAKIVHEAVHASFDAKKSYILALEEEAVAYVAHCYYLQLVAGPSLPTSNFSWKPIAEKAWPIATAKRLSHAVAASAYAELTQAVQSAYPHLDPSKFYTHDGV